MQEEKRSIIDFFVGSQRHRTHEAEIKKISFLHGRAYFPHLGGVLSIFNDVIKKRNAQSVVGDGAGSEKEL